MASKAGDPAETARQEMQQQNDGTKEQGTKELGTKEQGTKEQCMKEQGTKEKVVRRSVTLATTPQQNNQRQSRISKATTINLGPKPVEENAVRKAKPLPLECKRHKFHSAEKQLAIQLKRAKKTWILDLSSDSQQSYFTHDNIPEQVFEVFAMKRLTEAGRGLQQLWLSNNSLTSVCKEIGSLLNLQTLALDGNMIRELPSEIGKLRRLERLILRKNQLSELPAELSKVDTLREVYLDENNFSEFPKEVLRLRTMCRLSLTRNKLRQIPPEIVKLRRLSELSLDDNEITSDSLDAVDWACMSETMRVLGLANNKLDHIPKEILISLRFLCELRVTGNASSIETRQDGYLKTYKRNKEGRAIPVEGHLAESKYFNTTSAQAYRHIHDKKVIHEGSQGRLEHMMRALLKTRATKRINSKQ